MEVQAGLAQAQGVQQQARKLLRGSSEAASAFVDAYQRSSDDDSHGHSHGHSHSQSHGHSRHLSATSDSHLSDIQLPEHGSAAGLTSTEAVDASGIRSAAHVLGTSSGSTGAGAGSSEGQHTGPEWVPVGSSKVLRGSVTPGEVVGDTHFFRAAAGGRGNKAAELNFTLVRP